MKRHLAIWIFVTCLSAFSAAQTVVYSTPSAATTNSIGSTTMATAGASGNTYRVSFYVEVTVGGSGCTVDPYLQISASWQGPSDSASSSTLFAEVDIPTTLGRAQAFKGGTTAATLISVGGEIVAKASTAVAYSTNYVKAGDGCITQPTYKVYPILEQI